MSRLLNNSISSFLIKSISFRRILNSHVDFTTEFILELDDNLIGVGSSPLGETLSIYEDRKIEIKPENIIKKIEEDGYIGKRLSQKNFDSYLKNNIWLFGRNNAYSLSLALLKENEARLGISNSQLIPMTRVAVPIICFNILNGGSHAYTNPVLSDFPEYLLVAKSTNLDEIIEDHNAIQRIVKERLNKLPKQLIGNNLVNVFATNDNRECIDFLCDVMEHLKLKDRFGLMIDASAGDLWCDNKYCFRLTNKNIYESESLVAYWTDIIYKYKILFLEDPFAERDTKAWHKLTTGQNICKIIGDNFYCSDAEKIEIGAKQQYSHGVIIKPNQSGTISDVCKAVETTKKHNLVAIASHRSISTEETFLSNLTCSYNLPYIKIGPLTTDYSSILRLNEIIRSTARLYDQKNNN